MSAAYATDDRSAAACAHRHAYAVAACKAGRDDLIERYRALIESHAGAEAAERAVASVRACAASPSWSHIEPLASREPSAYRPV